MLIEFLDGNAARTLMTYVNKKFPVMPFSLSHFQTDGKSVDLETFNGGVLECCANKGPTNKEILEQSPVIGEVAGEFVAQFKATVVIQPSKTSIIAGGADLTDKLDSGKKMDAETAALVGQKLWEREKKQKK